MFSKDIILKIRSSADLLEIAREQTHLTQRGSRFHGLCPFHEEQTPSFSLDPHRGIFHCFGCGAGGDVVAFYRRLTGRSFPETIADLALRFNVSLPLSVPSLTDVNEIKRALSAASAYFTDSLARPQAGEARSYLQLRAVPDSIIQQYGLGYSNRDWKGCLTALRADFGVDVLLAAGIIARSPQGQLYDVFRDRIVFPISDAAGSIVGFGGRALSPSAPHPYINTRQTVVFRKRDAFFGLPQALSALRTTHRAILVEGYFDVLACAAINEPCSLGLMGTSISPAHLRQLSRWVHEVVLLFDPDAAGSEASRQLAPSLIGASLSVLSTSLPHGQDPAALRETEGDEALRASLALRQDVVLRAIESLREMPENVDMEARTIAYLLKLIGACPSEPQRLAYARRAAMALNLSLRQIFSLLPTSPSRLTKDA